MYEIEEVEEFKWPDNLVELSDMLLELWEKYHNTDGRKKKLLKDIQDKYNEGAKLYNTKYSKLRVSDKGPVLKLIK